MQLCLQHLKPSERERAEKQLGPLEQLPLYRVQLDVDPAEREVKGRVQVEVLARKRKLTELFLRLTPNASGRKVTLSDAKLDGQPVALERPEPTLIRVPCNPPLEPGAVGQAGGEPPGQRAPGQGERGLAAGRARGLGAAGGLRRVLGHCRTS